MSWYKNKRISTKLIIGFLVVAFIAVIVGGVGVINLTTMEKASTELYEQNGLGLQYTGNAATTFQMVRYNTIKLTTYTTDTDIGAGAKFVDEIKIEMTALLDDLNNIIYSAEGKAHLATIEKEWANYLNTQAEVMSLVQAHENEQALSLNNEKAAPIGTIIRDTFNALMDVVSTNAELKATNNTKLANSSILIMIGVAAAGLLVSIILGVYISRLIGNPLKKMAEAARKLALGNVDIEMTSDTKDEIGDLVEAFTAVVEDRKIQVRETQRLASGDLTVELTMNSDKDVLNQSLINLVGNLNDLVVSIQSSADQVASGSNLVSNSSMALSQGATEQASSVEQLTASLQEIASQTTVNAQNAEDASQLAKNAKSDAEMGNSQMNDMLSAMEAINDSSSNISKIIKVIDDIAFQTNILALNAAVEAARAGQHGRGFAVVAEEVRNLAAKSANAAKETTDMIEGSIKKVEAGTKIATETAAALSKIVTEVAKAAELVAAIARASNEQASAIEQINQGILMVSQVVQNNAATSEESAAASEELNSQAEQLQETISVFKVKQDYQSITSGTDARHLGERKPQAKTAARAAINAPRPNISLNDSSFGKY